MNLISVLGLVVLLALAWAMSYYRKDFPVRTVVWGLGLQFLFALIILREDVWSFVGMVILGLLILAFIARPAGQRVDAMGFAITALPAVAIAAILALLTPNLLFGAAVILALTMAANAIWLHHTTAQRYAAATLVSLLIAGLIFNGITGQVVFAALSEKVSSFLNLSDYGARFLFANLADPEHYFPQQDDWPGFGFLFAFKVLPTIVFFGGFMAVLYYLGVMQKVIDAMSRFVRWTIGTSGAETLSCSANIFVGQTEAPLLIRPFLPGMTRSELLTVMVGGFATIAGGVLAGYIGMGVPAGHLIAASVMSAPAALVVGKVIYPEKEHSETAGDVSMPEIDSGDNVIEAAASGITDGLKLAVNVGAMLLGFIALIAVVDVGLNFLDGWIDGRLLGGAPVEYGSGGLSPVTGEYEGWFPGSLQTLFGTILAPLAWVMGVPWADAAKVGNLLGIKLSLNEFVAYGTLGSYIQNQELSQRAIIISTYALCGFANFSSIGIQIGGMAAIAPGRRSDLAKVGLKAMFGGAIASWMTATIAGLLIV